MIVKLLMDVKQNEVKGKSMRLTIEIVWRPGQAKKTLKQCLFVNNTLNDN